MVGVRSEMWEPFRLPHCPSQTHRAVSRPLIVFSYLVVAGSVLARVACSRRQCPCLATFHGPGQAPFRRQALEGGSGGQLRREWRCCGPSACSWWGGVFCSACIQPRELTHEYLRVPRFERSSRYAPTSKATPVRTKALCAATTTLISATGL